MTLIPFEQKNKSKTRAVFELQENKVYLESSKVSRSMPDIVSDDQKMSSLLTLIYFGTAGHKKSGENPRRF